MIQATDPCDQRKEMWKLLGVVKEAITEVEPYCAIIAVSTYWLRHLSTPMPVLGIDNQEKRHKDIISGGSVAPSFLKASVNSEQLRVLFSTMTS